MAKAVNRATRARDNSDKGSVMRIVPLITAALVAAVLYAIVIERDDLLATVADLSPRSASEDTVEAPAEADASQAPVEERVEGTVAVIAKRSVAQEIDSAVMLRGETEASRQVSVQAETVGTVISTPLRRGTFVEAGQILCEIDPGTRPAALAEAQARLAEARARRPEVEARIPEAEARLEEAKARLEEAQINANAASKLSADGFASDTRVAATRAAVRAAEAGVTSAEAGVKAARSGLDSLQAAVETAQATVQRANTEIDRLTVVAPFSGLLETDTAELGTLLQGGNALCATIIQLDPIKLVGFVPETQVNRIEDGALGGARLTDGSEVTGRVTFLSRSADPVTRTFRVEVTVPNPDLSIRDGQTAEILIASDGALAHLLPSSALTLDDGGRLGVRIVTAEDTALFKPVTLLRDTADGIWVTGLSETENVILVGQEFVIDGVPVAASYEEVIQ